jgi:hypothetical protein
LGDEVDANPFGAHQTDHLFNLLQQDFGRIVKQQVSLVEEEDAGGLGGVPHLGEVLEELGQKPEDQGGIELGGIHQLLGGQDIDDSFAVGRGLEEIVEVEGWFTKEAVGALVLQAQKIALDGSDARGGNIPVLRPELVGVFPHIPGHGFEILQIQEQEAIVVGNFKNQVENAALGVIEIEQTGQQEGTHFGDGGAHRMAL